MNKTRALVATTIGNTLEWYDFVVYAQFAGAIAVNFFPGGDPHARLLKAFLAFGVAFLARPVGAVMIGSYADRAGRKAALTLTLFLMAAGTGVIAASPTYATIGIGAPMLLLVGRILQGLSAGGEVGSAAAYLFESAEAGAQGRFGAWLQASMGMANIVGAVVAFGVTGLLDAATVVSWGWRLPFVLGLAIIPAGAFLRRTLDETAAFRAQASLRNAARSPAVAPWRELLGHHGSSLCVGFCIATLWAVASYVLVIFLPTYVQRPDTFGFTAAQAFGASVIANIPLVAGAVVVGHWSDRIGRRTMLGASAMLLLVTVMPLFAWLHAAPSLGTLILFQSAMCVLVATIGGVAPAALAGLFPTDVRTSGTAVVYNSAFALFGGFAPAILTWLAERPGGALFAPAWYVMGAAALALAALPFVPAPAQTKDRGHLKRTTKH